MLDLQSPSCSEMDCTVLVCGPQESPTLRFHMPSRAIISSTSDIPQNDVSDSIGPDSMG